MNGSTPTKSLQIIVVLCVAALLLAVASRALRSARPTAASGSPHPDAGSATAPPSATNTGPSGDNGAKSRLAVAKVQPSAPVSLAAGFPVATNKLEHLEQIRAAARALAAGDRTLAIRTARAIVDENDREIALSTLVTEWTHGELGPVQDRAKAIAMYGLEVGLGMELAKQTELALLWADELTADRGKSALIQRIAQDLVASDPAAAFALNHQVPDGERAGFDAQLFTRWASVDTGAALEWAEQLPNAADREAAVEAIRTSAPVGIGAAMAVKDGYPVINQLVAGAPAELSGQLHVGDRIVAIAQGDNAYIDANNLPLTDVVKLVRGPPNTWVQLQVIPQDAPAGTSARTISILRNQIKFKQ